MDACPSVTYDLLQKFPLYWAGPDLGHIGLHVVPWTRKVHDNGRNRQRRFRRVHVRD